jgi:AAA+ ATPase superfamily predicted ATPase
VSGSAFIGRKDHLALLNRQYALPTGAFVVIYGRRRVGKTELIKQFIKRKPTLFFTGKESPRQLLIDDFIEQANLFYGTQLAKPGEISSWKTALTLATAGWRGPRRLIIVFDEIQWAASDKASPELISTLQEFWDHQWQASPHFLLVICSSFVGFTERLLGSKSPLFGRTTAPIFLKPLSPSEARLFCPSYSLTHQAQTYFLAGGIPLYHRHFDPEHSFEQNFIEHFLSPTSPLYREGDFLLREEFKEMPSYFAILTTIANQRKRHKEMIERTKLTDLQYYLHRLMELQYVRKVVPLADRVPRTDVFYEIQDPFLRFWFRFLFKHLSPIELLGPDKAYERLIKPDLEAYFGRCFEQFCRERLPDIYTKQEKLRCAFNVGEYWKAGAVQIDVVGQRDDGWIDLGECKWGAVRSLPTVLAELDKKIPLYPRREDYSIGRRIFLHHALASKTRLSAQIHTLEDLYQVS